MTLKAKSECFSIMEQLGLIPRITSLVLPFKIYRKISLDPLLIMIRWVKWCSTRNQVTLSKTFTSSRSCQISISYTTSESIGNQLLHRMHTLPRRVIVWKHLSQILQLTRKLWTRIKCRKWEAHSWWKAVHKFYLLGALTWLDLAHQISPLTKMTIKSRPRSLREWTWTRSHWSLGMRARWISCLTWGRGCPTGGTEPVMDSTDAMSMSKACAKFIEITDTS